MKKSRILMGALALALAGVAILACNKEKAEIKTSAETETISKEDDMSAYLKQFKEKMQSAAKGNETLSMEDARWHLEAVLNYTYGDAGHQTSDIQCDTFYCTLHANGEEVTLAQLNEAFEALSYDVEKAYGNCNLPDKSVLAIQTSFESGNKSGDVVVRSVLSTRGLVLPPWPPRFDSTDYWYPCYDMGKCGEYQWQYAGERGAETELTRMLNLRISGHECANGHAYFTDYEEIEKAYYMDSFLVDPLSPCGYKIFMETIYNHQPYSCISPEEMNYYLEKGDELMNYYSPAGKVIVSCRYEFGCWTNLPPYDIFHTAFFTYAKVNCTNLGNEY